jgi:hypothetical protein
MSFQFPISSPCLFKRNKGVGCDSFYCGCTHIWYCIWNRVSGVTFAIGLTCMLTLKMYKYMELQVFVATPKPNCEPSCKKPLFFHSINYTKNVELLLQFGLYQHNSCKWLFTSSLDSPFTFISSWICLGVATASMQIKLFKLIQYPAYNT